MRWLLLLLLFCICPALAEEPEGYAVTRENVGVISMMSEPASSSEKLSTYDANVWAAVSAQEGEWYRVEMPDGMKGYIQQSCLERVSITYRQYGIVSNSSDREFLNLREEPGFQSRILGTYYNGVPCVILSHESDGWYHVRVDGVEGYFREEYIRESILPYGEHVVTVHAGSRNGVNMRSGPGYQWPASRLCEENSYLTVVHEGKEWWLVSDAGQIGFVRSEVLYDGILNPVFQDQAVNGATAVVNNPKATQVLNMREKPTRFSASLAQYSNGTRFTLLQQGTQWCRVSDDNGNTGWCMTEFLTLYGAQETPKKTVVHPDETYVNLRAAPSSIAGAVLAQVPHGAEVIILIPDADEWTLVDYQGLDGYMYSSFLQ